MRGDIAVVTVTTRNYLHRTRVLMQEVARYLPEARRIVCCADPIADHCDVAAEPYEIVEAASFGIPRFQQLALALNPTALCCLLKASVVQYVLADEKTQRVVYIDNDVGLYRRPEEMVEALKNATMVLTPHHLKPLAAGAEPNEQTLVSYGTFNAGIFGVRKSEESAHFLSWWKSWMLDPRHLGKQTGYDQVWLNYVPVYCPQMQVLRDKSYNVAFWNLGEREFRMTEGGQFKCGKEDLTSFHFSNFSDEHPENLVWPQCVSNLEPTKASECVVAEIVKKWNKAKQSECASWGYGFSLWPDGKKILESERETARFKWDDIPTGANPWIDVPGTAEKNLLAIVRPCGVKRSLRQWKIFLWKLLDVSPQDVFRKLRGILFKKARLDTHVNLAKKIAPKTNICIQKYLKKAFNNLNENKP